MNLPQLAIRRPVTMWMVFLSAILIGVVSLLQLPVELYPNISFGRISIIVYVRGGIPPTEIESLVTRPIEEAVATVSHLKEIISESKEGESNVMLLFEPETNMDFAALEVREKFARIKNKLPKEIEKPVIAQFEQTDMPVMILAVTSLEKSTEEIRKIVDDVVKERLKRVTGVANIDVSGGRERKIMVEVDQNRLAAYGLSLDRVIAMLSLSNLNLLAGDIEQEKDKYLIRTIGEFESISDIENIGVATTPQGSLVRLKDVARVEDSYLDATGYARYNIRPVVSLYVQKESTENTIKVVEQLLKEVEKVKPLVPKDVDIIVTSNQAEFIKKAINNLNSSLLEGALLIIIVLLFFLRGIRREWVVPIFAALLGTLFLPDKLLYVALFAAIAALVISKPLRSILVVVISIPISVIITFALMKWRGLTMNFMTLFGLALGVGMLVDNSIVVYENILKKKEHGESDLRASVDGSSEVFIAIVASTLTTVIVFLPLVFVGQEMRIMYGGVAWTVMFSLIISLFVAVTVVPQLSVKFGVEAGAAEGSGNSAGSAGSAGSAKPTSGESILTKERITSKDLLLPLYRRHRKALCHAIRSRYKFLGIVSVVFLLSFVRFSMIGKEFLGTTEQNKFTAFIELPTGARLEASDVIVGKVEKLLRKVPEVKSFSSRVEPWSSKIYVELVPVPERGRTVTEVTDSLRPETDKIEPAFIYYEEEREVGTTEIILDLFGYDYDVLRELAINSANRLKAIKGLTDVKIRMREGRPEMGVKVDKQKAALAGLSVRSVADMVHAQMRGLRATLYHTEGKEVETVARLDEKYRKTFPQLHKLILTSQDGKNVFLEQISDFKFGLGPSEIWRKNRSRMVQVSANIGRLSLSDVVKKIHFVLRDVKFPEGYYYRFGGNYPLMVKTQQQFRLVICLVLALVYIVLASLYESYYQPFIIMVSVPLALIGVVLVLFLPNVSVGMGVLVGMMMLAGIVVNNSIILIDHTNFLRLQGMRSLRAVVMASKDRLRPILMTTSTTILGLLPMAIDRSEGANLWRPLALTVIGGLSSSTLLTLILIPGIYIIFEDAKFWLSNLRNGKGLGLKVKI